MTGVGSVSATVMVGTRPLSSLSADERKRLAQRILRAFQPAALEYARRELREEQAQPTAAPR